jgi:peptide/nickel transport system permease protein
VASEEARVASTPFAFDRSEWQLFRRASVLVRKQPLGAASAGILLLLAALAVVGPWIAPYDPYRSIPGSRLQPPSWSHWLGTDEIARDVLSRIIYGARTSVTVGLVGTGIGTIGGTIVGLTSGYFGRWVDLTIQRIIDTVLALPSLILVLAVVALLGQTLFNIFITLGILLIPWTSRVVRSAVLSIKQEQFVEAASSLGASHLRIMLRHILPNVVAPVIIIASVQIGFVIITEATLGFLGLGIPPPMPSWGGMLSVQGRRFMEIAPWLAIAPGLAIAVTVLAMNLFGDALRDMLDPRTSRS